jgi:hypothetical protein
MFRLAREIVARRLPVKYVQSLSFWIGLQGLIVSGILSGSARAGDAWIIGANQPQKRLLECVAQIAANELLDTPNSSERLTVIILEHKKFLEMRENFHAHKTQLAFSSMRARRIYLSSRVLGNSDTLLRCITHELGHFETQSVYEDNAEFAANRMRQRARQICGSEVQ